VIVLGFDTATRATAVALRLHDGRMLDVRDDPGPGEHPGHATRLLAMAEGLLESAGIRWRSVDRIAVGLGPGTFTGLRVGVATARGLAQSLSLELVGVSSTEALAEAAINAPPDAPPPDASPDAPPDAAQAPWRGGVLALIDARRGEVFAAAYAGGGDGVPRELLSPRALAPEDALGAIALAEEQGAERGLPWLALGDGAVRFRDHLQMTDVIVPDDSSSLHLVDGRAVCALGVRGRPAGSGEQILPDYRRLPDAEINREAAVLPGGEAR
jgi:tRNA threonylcarbamoyladenosine biosynthesis protein TsaB